MAERLEGAGAKAIAMPCNTAHHYAGAIRAAICVPFLDMVALASDHAADRLGPGGRVGLLASPAVRMTGLYEAALGARGLDTLWPEDDAPMLAAIREIKAGGRARRRSGRRRSGGRADGPGRGAPVRRLHRVLADRRPLAPAVPVVDTLDILAAEIVAFAQAPANGAARMTVTYLKRAEPRPRRESADLRDTVAIMLARIEQEGEDGGGPLCARPSTSGTARSCSTPRRAPRPLRRVPQALQDNIRFAHDNIRRFAEAQKATLTDCEVELLPGHWAGQKQIPVSSAGCYVPGGRYAHIASALMTVTTARVAGVTHVTAASPPRGGEGIPDAVVFAMDLAGADMILNLGGVQAIAAMAFGLYGVTPADILVGPGNAFVAEAKRKLFGRVGIDMVAGPTDTLVIADATADPETVAWDLVGQAEHGADSPVWLVTSSRALAERVIARVPGLCDSLPDPNAAVARAAWEDRGEVVLCDTHEEMAATSDRYAPEHLHVMAADLDWWLGRLTAYGSLFLGAGTTVPFGDKVSGPNHVLPTGGAARYTGGLSVQKFTKTVTWQRTTGAASQALARLRAISAGSKGWRATRAPPICAWRGSYPDEVFDLTPNGG